MNATDFMKEHGIERAREVVEGAPDWATGINLNSLKYFGGDCFCGGDLLVSDLKRLVESLDLVKSYGGLINAKHDVKYLDLDCDYDTPRITRLKQAIADYESIGGEHV